MIDIRREQHPHAARAGISLFDSCALLGLAQHRRRRRLECRFYGAGEAQFTAISSMVIGRSRTACRSLIDRIGDRERNRHRGLLIEAFGAGRSRLSRSAGHSDKDARSSAKDAASSAMSFSRNCSSNVEMIGKPVELF
jgi:hypothetical protein